MAAGVAAFDVSIFHVFTHAFFKAALFLGAGAVIHSLTGEQDMRRMGGLLKKMPLTSLVMIFGFLAIIGFPGFAGFWSKDLILERLYVSGQWDHMFTRSLYSLRSLRPSIWAFDYYDVLWQVSWF